TRLAPVHLRLVGQGRSRPFRPLWPLGTLGSLQPLRSLKSLYSLRTGRSSRASFTGRAAGTEEALLADRADGTVRTGRAGNAAPALGPSRTRQAWAARFRELGSDPGNVDIGALGHNPRKLGLEPGDSLLESRGAAVILGSVGPASGE